MHPTRRDLLAAAGAASLASADATRPNILYIMTDQQHAAMMSCAGNRWLKTRAMDRIVRAGVRFELAYSSNPVCVPARVSMMTGRYPSHFGIRGNNNPDPLPAEAATSAMGNLFRAAGYSTAFGGKTHWPKPMNPESVGFEYLTRDARDELAEKCCDFLRRKHERPFLLVASFINPHDICYMAIDAHAKAVNLPDSHAGAKIERQRVAEASAMPAGVSREQFFAKHCPPLPANHGPTKDEPGDFAKMGNFRGYVRRNWTAEDWRLHRWAYCRLTERVDTEVGRVLDALDASGLARNTLIVFASDHGDMDAAHGFEHKSLPYEESARVPFLISWPGRIPTGRVDRTHLVSASIDLLPTLCDCAGIQPPARLPGRSVLPVATGTAPADWRRDLVVECSNGRSLRTARYKYTVWEGRAPREMLIDMVKDPGEMDNLASSPAHRAVLDEHRRLLRERVEERTDVFGRSLLSESD